MKKVVLISALLGTFAVNVFATNTPSDVNQNIQKLIIQKLKLIKNMKLKLTKKQKSKHQLNNAQP